jgi:ABC-type transport system involved in cytochrome bd biosynthesis fused ATPase/permease subunit
MDPILLASLQQAEVLGHLHNGVQDLDQVLLHAVAAVVDGVAVVAVAVVVASCIEAAAAAYGAAECVVERVEQIVDHQVYEVEMEAENPPGS